MEIKLEMPDVAACEARSCAYNRGGDCNARAITVGDTTHPGCDTFVETGGHVRNAHQAGVGACKVADCRFNDDLECQAEHIRVGQAGADVRCETYRTH